MPSSDNPLAAQLRQREASAKTLFAPAETLPEPPPGPLWRQVRACAPPEYATRSPLSLDQARATIRTRIDDYLNLPAPAHMLLVRAVPGVGKTTAAVETAEACAAKGWRVAYAGPRHDFFADVTAIARQPDLWYEWLPRTEGNDEMPRTCDWTPQINEWLMKGYEGIDFCSRVCGWQYINDTCRWHRQKTRSEPIIFLQHQHVASGHPLEFRVLIGDENPLQAFLRKWDIPAKQVRPSGMDYADPLFEILVKLAGLCAGGELLDGLGLMDALGGAAEVLAACESFVLPADVIAAADIHSAWEADQADYFHLPQLVPLLAREARAVADDRLYPPRIIAGKGDLTLLLRRRPAARWPSHLVWLDATGNEHIYAELFGRPVEVVDAAPQLAGHVTVITDRTNGKGDFKSEQAAAMVRKIVADNDFTAPAVVTFQGAEAEIAGGWTSAHFYGARGTNRLEKCDALFVVGAPMPAQPVIQTMAAMLYFNRMIQFGRLWSDRFVAYHYTDPVDGQGREYPAGGWWADPDLQALLWQLREAEILQAVHRARPVHRAVPIYLLTNLPVPELAVHRLATAAELMSTPVGVKSLYDWQRFLEWVNGRETVTASEIQAGLNVSVNTAIKYRDLLAAQPGWELAASRTAAGRQSKIASRLMSPSVALINILNSATEEERVPKRF